MNEPKTTNESKKQKWIKTEHDKAVQIHWDNLRRIKNLDSKIRKATRTISFIEKSINLLEKTKFEYEEIKNFSIEELKIFAECEHSQYWEHDSNARMFAETYDIGIEHLHIRQKELCFDVYKWQKEIDKNSFDTSVEIMHKDSDEKMLSKKYDRLFNKKAMEVK
tara:strand:+ start:38 stop:529 length:492 start_codon:yes stop_codon:yes gene_type:complete